MNRAPLSRISFASVFWILILGATVAPTFWTKKAESPVDVPRKLDLPAPTVVQKTPALTAAVDTDHDGMPDAWETAHFLNPNDPTDAASDFDLDGVTALEEFLNNTNPLGVWSAVSFSPPSTLPSLPAGTWRIHAAGINSNGLTLVQFWVTSPSYRSRWYTLQPGTGPTAAVWTDVTPTANDQDVTYGRGINDSGAILFSLYQASTSSFKGVIRLPDGTIQELHDTNGGAVNPYRFNDYNEWVGVTSPGGQPRIFRDGHISGFSNTAAWTTYSYADINDDGEVLGTYVDPGTGQSMAFLQVDDFFFPTGIPGTFPFDTGSTVTGTVIPSRLDSYGDFSGMEIQPGYNNDQRAFSYDGSYHAWNIGSDMVTGFSAGMDNQGRILLANGVYLGTGFPAGVLANGDIAAPITGVIPGLRADGWELYGSAMSRRGSIVLTNSTENKIYLCSPNQDQDGDGMSDDWETIHGLNPNDRTDADTDADNDGVSNLGEYRLGTNPIVDETVLGPQPPDLRPGVDTDGDGIPNVWEWEHGLDYQDPTDADSQPLNAKTDPDRDGYSNLQEYRLQTDPHGAPAFRVKEVGAIPDATRVSYSPGLLGNSGHDDLLLYTAKGANASYGSEPAQWKSPQGIQVGSGASFNYLDSSDAIILAFSPSGAVATTSSSTPGILNFWRSRESGVISVPGSGSDIAQFNACALSPTGEFLAGGIRRASTQALEGMICKMPALGSSAFMFPPASLYPAAPIISIDWTSLKVNDYGFAIANGTTSGGLTRSMIWKIPATGAGSVTTTVLGTLTGGNSTTAVGLSNSPTPVIAGWATTGVSGEYRAVAWSCSSGVAYDLAVRAGTNSKVNAISNSGVLAGTWKSTSGTAPSTQCFVSKEMEGLPIYQPQGPVEYAVTISSVNDAGEIFGSGQAVAGAPTIPFLWRGGSAYPLNNLLPQGYVFNSVVSCNENGSLWVRASKNGDPIQLILSQDQDTDGDGMPDAFENQYGFNPYSAADASLDPDGDHLTNLQEFLRGTNPMSKDTDGDGMDDDWEIAWGLNPCDGDDAFLDPDGDGVNNLQEFRNGTRPTGLFKVELLPLNTYEYFTGIDSDGSVVTYQPDQIIYNLTSSNPNYTATTYQGWGYKWKGFVGTDTTRTSVAVPFGDWDPETVGQPSEYHETYVYPVPGGKVDGFHIGELLSPFAVLPGGGSVFSFNANSTSTSKIANWSDIAGSLSSDNLGSVLPIYLMSPSRNCFALKGNTKIQFIDASGNKMDEFNYLPAGYTAANWQAINNAGDIIGTLQPGNQIAWRKVGSGSAITLIPKPSDWGTDAWGLAYNVISNDDVTILERDRPIGNGQVHRERYLFDLVSGSLTPINFPDVSSNEAITQLASNSRILGSGSKPWIISNGSTLLLEGLSTYVPASGSTPVTAKPFSQNGWTVESLNNIGDDGRITVTVKTASGDRKLAILSPVLDADGNGIPDDYEVEMHNGLPPGTDLHLNVDYDGDGYTLAQELAAGTSDVNLLSKPAPGAPNADRDHDGVPDDQDPDPDDPVIDWHIVGSMPKFAPIVMKDLSGDIKVSPFYDPAGSDSDHPWLDMIDMSAAGDILYSISNTNSESQVTRDYFLVTKNSEIQISIDHFDPLHVTKDHGVVGSYYTIPDEGEHGYSDLRKTTDGQQGSMSILPGPELMPGYERGYSFNSNDDYVVSYYDDDENWVDTFKGGSPLVFDPFYEISCFSDSGLLGLEDTTNEAKDGEIIELSPGGQIVSQKTLPREGNQFAAPFSIAKLVVEHYVDPPSPSPTNPNPIRGVNTEKRNIVVTWDEGVYVAHEGADYQRAKNVGGGLFVSKQGWLLKPGSYSADGDDRDQGPSLWIDGSTVPLNHLVEMPLDSHNAPLFDKIKVLGCFKMSEAGLITALAEYTTGGTQVRKIINLIPVEVDLSQASQTSQPAAAVAAPDSFRKVAFSGKQKSEAKPQSDSEVDLQEENTYVDAYTRYLRHDTSHVYQPVPASDLALQATMTWDGSPLPIGAADLRSPVGAVNLEIQRQNISRNIEGKMAADMGPFGAGWSSNLSARAVIDVKMRPRQDTDPNHTSTVGGDLAFAEAFIDEITVEVTDESGSIYEFRTGDLINFFPLASHFPKTTDSGTTLVRQLPAHTGDPDVLLLKKKFGVVCKYSCSDLPTFDSGRRFTAMDARKYSAGLVSVKDRYGNEIVYGGTGVSDTFGLSITGRPALKFSYHLAQLSAGPGHAPYRLVDVITDALQNRTYFTYSWADILGAKVPVLVQVAKPDGSVQRYSYTTRMGTMKPLGDDRSTEELVKSGVAVLESTRDPNDLTNPKHHFTIDDIKTLSSRMNVAYCHINLTQIVNPSGAAWNINYESTPRHDMVNVNATVNAFVHRTASGVNIPVDTTDEAGDFLTAIQNEAKQDLFASAAKQYEKLGGKELTGSDPTIHTGIFATPAVEGPDVVTTVAGPEGSGFSITSANPDLTNRVKTDKADHILSPMVDPSYPAIGVQRKPGYSKVTNSMGQVIEYYFTDPILLAANSATTNGGVLENQVRNVGNLQGRNDNKITIHMVGYAGLDVHTHANVGTTEKVVHYHFDPNASLALSATEDNQGIGIGYAHTMVTADPGLASLWNRLDASTGAAPTPALSCAPDPTSESQGPLAKAYTYDPSSRRMVSSVDRKGNETIDTIVNGLRTQETSYAGRATAGVILSSQTFEYGNSLLPSFLTKSTVKKFSGAMVDPAWVADMVTTYVPDTYGHVASTTVTGTVVDPTTNIATEKSLTTSYVYDAAGRKQSETDPNGNTTTFGYDSVGHLKSVTYPGGGIKTFGYNVAGQKIRETDELGHSTLYQYDQLGRVVASGRDISGASGLGNGVLDAGDLITRTAYDSDGMPTDVTDPNGNVTHTDYDAYRRPVAVTDANGGITRMDYGDGLTPAPVSGSGLANGPGYKPVRICNPRGYLTLRTYDTFYRLISEKVEFKLPDGMTEGTAALGWLTRTPAADRMTDTETQYDDNGNANLVTKYHSSGAALVTSTTYDGLNRPVTTTAAYGDPYLANTTHSFYTSTGLKWATVAYEGLTNLQRRAETEYDKTGRAVAVWSPDPLDGSKSANSACVRTGYDANGNVVTVTDPLANVTTTTYDSRNRPTDVYAPAAPVYNPGTGATASQRARHHTDYDLSGKVMEVTDPRGTKTHTYYDAANRATKVTSALGADVEASISTTYDANGNVIAVQDAEGAFTRNQYDALNRLTATAVNPVTGNPSANFASPATNDIVVTNFYDAVGNLILVADGEAPSWSNSAHTTNFTYDGLNRKISQGWDNNSLLNAQTWTYDSLVMTGTVNGRGQSTTFDYDALLRPTGQSYLAATGDNTALFYSDGSAYAPYTAGYHSGPGPLVGIEHPNAGASQPLVDTASKYDRLDRVVEETSGGEKHGYAYDIAGNRNLVTYARTGRKLVTKYDGAGRVSSIIDASGTVGADPSQYTALAGDPVTGYFYDIGGLVLRKTLANNTATANSYDARGRLLTSNTARYPTSGPAVLVSSFDYSHSPIGRSLPSGYDRVGSVLRVEETYAPIPSSGTQGLRTINNSYDYAYRLTTEQKIDGADTTSTSYTYDRANNRRSRIVQTNGNPAQTVYWVTGNPTVGYNTNQLYGISVAGLGAAPSATGTAGFKTIYAYDKDGSRTTRTTDPGAAGSAVDTYAYDQRNRLKSVTTTVSGATTATSSYAYDERTRRTRTVEASGTRRLSFSGGNYVQEYPAALNTQPSSEIVRGSDMGGGVGGILYTKTTSSGAVFSNFNSRGDVVSQTNASGGVDFEAKYDAFGKHLDTGIATGRQRANSKDEDPTGLLNEGMRYRDLEAGIFLTRDPAGFVDGPNVYTYVRQNPWTKFDPTGLSATRMWADLFSGDFMGAAKQLPNVLTGGLAPVFGSNPIDGIVQEVKTTAAIARADGVVDAALYVANSLTGGQQIAEGMARLGTGTDSDGNLAYQQISAHEGNLRIADGGEQMVMTALGTKDLVMGAADLLGASARETTGSTATAVEGVCSEGPDGACFLEGTEVMVSEGEKKIEDVKVGDRVLSVDDSALTQVDPQTWKKIVLAMPNPSYPSDILHIELLRSPRWMASAGCEEGTQISFQLAEMGIRGPAHVESISKCPPIQKGPGKVVLSTVKHFNAFLIGLKFENGSEELKVTDQHRIFSATRGEWVQASQIQPGEQLRTINGPIKVAEISEIPGTYLVYNLEVEKTHCYFAGTQNILSHNECATKGGAYTLAEEDGQVVRTGRSKDLARRKGEHARNPETADLKFETDVESDDYDVQRGAEHRLYESNPGARAENGGLNKQKAIRDNHPKKQQFIEADKTARDQPDEDQDQQ